VPVYNVGFPEGIRKYRDSDGVFTLEALSKALSHATRRSSPALGTPGMAVQIGTQISANCPYFRFALGYRPGDSYLHGE
jgi:hypothetical protein